MTIKIHSSRISEFSPPSPLTPLHHTMLFDACSIVGRLVARRLPTNYGRQDVANVGRTCHRMRVASCLQNAFKSQYAALTTRCVDCCLPILLCVVPRLLLSPPCPCHTVLTPPASAAAVVVCNLMSFSLRPNRRCLCEPLFCCNHVASQRVVQHRAAQRAPCCCYCCCFASFCRCR